MKEAFTTTARLFVDEDQVIWVQYAADVQLDVDDILNIFGVAKRLSGGKAMPMIVDLRHPYKITPEARERAIEETKSYPATALITSSVLYKYISDIYSKLYTRAAPIKVFLNEEKALEWVKPFAVK